jgi:hypothetical protein
MTNFFCRAACIAALSVTTPLLSAAQANASNCEITSCRGGGHVSRCWNAMQREANTKRKQCGIVVIASGVSAYAMATTLPGTCIKSNATISIHRPYRTSYKTVARGSRWHNYYFGRIRPSAVRYFQARGGMQREGFNNATYMVAVPARLTGVPICR